MKPQTTQPGPVTEPDPDPEVGSWSGWAAPDAAPAPEPS
jgi:hypothetical protein